MAGDLIIDASAFFFRSRFEFLLKLLKEEEFSPDRIIVANYLYYLFLEYLKKKELPQKQEELIREIVIKWERFNVERSMKWILSREFVVLLDEFFTVWKPLPAEEVIGYGEKENPISLREFRKKLGRAGEVLYEELKTSEKTKTCILCLSRALSYLLRRMKMYFIEIPHTKKKKFMEKHSWMGGLLFYFVVEVSSQQISPKSLEQLINEFIKYAPQTTKGIFAEVNVHVLAGWLFDLLAPLGIGLVSVAIAFDSIHSPKKFLSP